MNGGDEIKNKKEKTILDISVPVRPGMPLWPGDPPVEFERTGEIGVAGGANLSLISMGAHAGTHVDAPLHYITGGKSIDEAPLSALVGPARVIEARGGPDGSISAEELAGKGIERGQRILLKTTNSALWRKGAFQERFIHLSASAAEFLAGKRILALGIDYLSVSGSGDDALVHRRLLEAGIWIIEGLDLTNARPGDYELICLPLRLDGLEAAPARACLRPLGNASV